MRKKENNYAFIDSQNLNLIDEYDAAVIVSSDGDFYSLVQHLYEVRKLKTVLSPDIEMASSLLKQTAREKINFMNNLRDLLEYKRKAPPGDKTQGSAFP